MPQKVLKFTGINRMVNEYQSNGACEELINLRPSVGGGHHVVRRKEGLRSGVQYVNLWEHSFGSTYNLIVLTMDGTVKWIDEEGVEHTIITGLKDKDVNVTSAGNVLMIYYSDLAGEYAQSVYKFENSRYVAYDVEINVIKSAEIQYAYKSTTFYGAEIKDDSTAGYNEALNNAAAAFHQNYPNGLCGVAVVGCTYELEDGSETWSTAFVVVNVTRCTGYAAPMKSDNSVVVTGASRVSLRITMSSIKSSGVKKINVYSTRPFLPYSGEKTETGAFNPKKLFLEENLNLDGQVMYYQGSISPDQTYASLTLNFGKDLAGEKIMDVTPGCIRRVGKAISYNGRFHFYESDVWHILQSPTISTTLDSRTEADTWIAYARINGMWKLINNTYKLSASQPHDFIYPLAGVDRLAFVKATVNSLGSITEVTYKEMFYVDMKDSAAYNYSYSFDHTPVIEDGEWFLDDLIDYGQVWGDGFDREAFLREEDNVISVSAPYNPSVFPVKYSYSFGGKILDIATSYLPISSTQVGQYPLTVFTSNGVYSLEQGSGDVLYSNIVPLQPITIKGKSAATPYGTFFVSGRSLFLLSGRDAVNISNVLNGELELSLRELDSYKRLFLNSSTMFFNFQPLLSKDNFENFIVDSALFYDQMHNELIISSIKEDIPYSYVFNLDTKSFHKIAKRYSGSNNNLRYAIEVVGDDRRMIDMYSETDSREPVFLQSRPMSLEILYTHIQRLVMLVDANLTGDDYLCLSVFGSDNLHDWKCIISSQKINTTLRQMRTNRAAKSYKDYVVVISGIVNTNTDISDIIADYTVVNRRLG